MTQPQDERDADPFLSLTRGATELYLIRHGDALPDAGEIVLGGDYDAQGLSALGRRQAEALANRLRAVPFDAIYSSPIGRAIQTAEPLARAQGVAIAVEPDLREAEVGAVEPAIPAGSTPEQHAALLRAQLATIARVVLTQGSLASIPGSEPSARLRARMLGVVDRIAAGHPGRRVALFSHSAAINAYLATKLGVPRDYFIPIANASLSIARIQGERFLPFTLNDIGHLLQAGLLDLRG